MILARYPTDLTDTQWAVLAPLIPAAKAGGRPRTTDMREVVNAVFYVLRGGCQWRLLPKDFPPYQTVYDYFRSWRLLGTWEGIHGGYDRGKHTLGRKRRIVVDVLGLLLIVMVYSAGIQDRNGAKHVLTRLISRFPGLKLVWADGGYAGKLVEWVATVLQHTLSIVKRPRKSQGFPVLQWRWIVERTFGWLNRSRRLSKDFEALPETTEAWIRIAMIQLMTRRLAAKT